MSGRLPALATGLALLAGAVAQAHAAGDAPLAATWQEHRGSVSYLGITSVYSCSGMETKVRQLLLLLGARKDASVHASSCSPGDMPVGPGLTILIRVHTLAPAAAAATAQSPAPASQPAAQWSDVRIEDDRPNWIQPGDCELIDQLREFISNSFTARHLEYRARCTPRQVDPDSFSIHGEFLKLAPP